MKKEVALELEQGPLEKSQARLEKLLAEWRKSQASQLGRGRRHSRLKPRKKTRTLEERGKREKKRQRRYSKSPAGRARRGRWEQSPQGKRARQQAYQERVKWLNEIKEKGCAICGEKNVLVLRFRVRDGEKAKFSPRLQNISRSKGDWLKVLKVSDVLCVRCLILQKQGRKPLDGRTREARKAREGCREGQETIKPSVEMVKLPEKPSLTKGREAISENRMLTTCECCEAEFKPKKKKQRFCTSRCRLIYWVAERLLEAFRVGRADGLRDVIRELSEAAKG